MIVIIDIDNCQFNLPPNSSPKVSQKGRKKDIWKSLNSTVTSKYWNTENDCAAIKTLIYLNKKF